MADSNSHLIEVDGIEYHLEVLGDEVVVLDFTEPWANFCRALTGDGDALRKFAEPNQPTFSFAATPELKALIFEANEYFDTHNEEASEEMDARITALAAPYIREFVKKTLPHQRQGDPI
jgi:hypothetical protein